MIEASCMLTIMVQRYVHSSAGAVMSELCSLIIKNVA